MLYEKITLLTVAKSERDACEDNTTRVSSKGFLDVRAAARWLSSDIAEEAVSHSWPKCRMAFRQKDLVDGFTVRSPDDDSDHDYVWTLNVTYCYVPTDKKVRVTRYDDAKSLSIEFDQCGSVDSTRTAIDERVSLGNFLHNVFRDEFGKDFVSCSPNGSFFVARFADKVPGYTVRRVRYIAEKLFNEGKI